MRLEWHSRLLPPTRSLHNLERIPDEISPSRARVRVVLPLGCGISSTPRACSLSHFLSDFSSDFLSDFPGFPLLFSLPLSRSLDGFRPLEVAAEV